MGDHAWVMPPLAEETLAQKFSELYPELNPTEALAEANRCLFCYDAPCIRACPTHINIPGFIKKISTGNLKGSARTILESNFLGATCARVCPVAELCEGACVMNELGAKPIAIGRLQRHATDYAMQHHIQLFMPGPSNGKRVAMVGGGPASLSCAAVLAQLGYAVTIFEKRPLAGGLDTYGIVVFREPMAVSLAEVEMVRALGVEIKTGVTVGQDLSATDLLANYDAIFLGLGMGRVPPLGIPGEQMEGVLDALDYVEATRTQPLHHIQVGRRVAVIGAGNTAVDAATISKRLGAEQVQIIYRRGEAEMTAYDFEYEFAKQEGVEYRFHVTPLRIEGHGRVERLVVGKTVLGEPDASGRRSPRLLPGSEEAIPVDMVIKATGQSRYDDLLDSFGVAHRHGIIQVDPGTLRTSNPKVFAGGDCILAGAADMAATVVATQHGKLAAQGIHGQLQAA